MASTKVPPEVRAAIEKWERARDLRIFSPDTQLAWQAVATLSMKGATTTDVVSVLELLRRYCQTAAFRALKLSRQQWLSRANNLVLRLRHLAVDAEKVLQFIAIRTPAGTSHQSTEPGFPSVAGSSSPVPGADSDSDSSMESPGASVEIEHERDRGFEPELWDVMRRYADDLEAYLRMEKDTELPLGEPFSRKFAGTAGTLVFLVLAAGLITETTGQPHYPEITTLLEIVCPEKALAEDSIIKNVTRFRDRNQTFVNQYLEQGSVRESVEYWLSEFE